MISCARLSERRLSGAIAPALLACDKLVTATTQSVLPAGVQVNYVGKAANLYEDAGYTLHGSAYVINKHLGMTHIWDRVRVMGGAYGGFCSFDSHSGLFQFLSYRCVSHVASQKMLLLVPLLSVLAGFAE